jgi:hypothetical protein
MVEIGERLRKTGIASLAIISSLGFLAVKPRQAMADCNVPKQIARIEQDIRSGQEFKQPVLRPEFPKITGSGIVKVFAKGRNSYPAHQFMIDPLVIECGSKMVRYVGVTNVRSNSLGTRYDTRVTDTNGEVYLDAVRPSEATIEAYSNSITEPFRQEPVIHSLAIVRFTDTPEELTQFVVPAFVGNHKPFGEMVS